MRRKIVPILVKSVATRSERLTLSKPWAQVSGAAAGGARFTFRGVHGIAYRIRTVKRITKLGLPLPEAAAKVPAGAMRNPFTLPSNPAASGTGT